MKTSFIISIILFFSATTMADISFRYFTGISSPYEAPIKPEIHILNDKISIEDVTEQIINYLQDRGYVNA